MVRSRCDEPNFHVDYAAGVGCRALTLITPLEDYKDSGSFELLYKTEEAAQCREAEGTTDAISSGDGDSMQKPASSLAKTRRYVYRFGKAIVFGASFRHSTEPGTSGSKGAPRAYLCFTFGTDQPEHWPLISQTIDSQSRCSRARMAPLCSAPRRAAGEE